MDIIYDKDDWRFSYRIAGILINDGKILLQKPLNDTGYAVPGGHVEFGEINKDTLVREFKEEIDSDITVNGLMFVGELFFPWGKKKCHQLCLYYKVELNENFKIPLTGVFLGIEKMENTVSKLEFHWIAINELKNIEVYPENLYDCIQQYKGNTIEFLYKENN